MGSREAVGFNERHGEVDGGWLRLVVLDKTAVGGNMGIRE